MQTFLYVLGPFLLQGGAGLGLFAIGIGAARALVKRAKASAALKDSETYKNDELIGWSVNAGRLLADLMVTKCDVLTDDQSSKLTELVTQGVSQKTIDYYDTKKAIGTKRKRSKLELT